MNVINILKVMVIIRNNELAFWLYNNHCEFTPLEHKSTPAIILFLFASISFNFTKFGTLVNFFNFH